MEHSTSKNDAEKARKYLDAAIRRHRDFGDNQTIPKDVYDDAVARTVETIVEFRELGSRRAAETSSS